MHDTVFVMESGSREKREGAFSVCSALSVQPGTDLLHKSRSPEQGRAQMGGRLQVTLQPLTQPSLAGCLCSPRHTLPLSPPLHPFVSLVLELFLPPAVLVGALWLTPSSTSQLKQWKAFEEESQTMSHMAKYFTSPSRSCHSVYSEEQLYQLIGEKNSMKRLLTEVRGCAGPPPPASPLPFCGQKALQSWEALCPHW